MVAHILPIDID